jgi:hypothetical protein
LEALVTLARRNSSRTLIFLTTLVAITTMATLWFINAMIQAAQAVEPFG